MECHRILFLAAIWFSVAYGLQRNITVEDTSSSVSYSGIWSLIQDGDGAVWDSGGTHSVTADAKGTATFNFTGVAIYFMSPLWPYNVNTVASIDGGTSVVIDLVDHSVPATLATDGSPTVKSAVVWGSGKLTNSQHSLKISVGSSELGYAVVDALIYTADDGVSATFSSQSSTSTSIIQTSTTSFTQRSTTTIKAASTSGAYRESSTLSSHKLPIILGSVVGGLALILIILVVLFFLCHRRRSRPVSNSYTDEKLTYTAPNGVPLNMHPIVKSGKQSFQSYHPDFLGHEAPRPEVDYLASPAPNMPNIAIAHSRQNYVFDHYDPYQGVTPSPPSFLPVHPLPPSFSAPEVAASYSSQRLPGYSELGQSNHAFQEGSMDAISFSGSHPGPSYQRYQQYSDQKEHLRQGYTGERPIAVGSVLPSSLHPASSYQLHFGDQKELMRKLLDAEEQSSQFASSSNASASHHPSPRAYQNYYHEQAEHVRQTSADRLLVPSVLVVEMQQMERSPPLRHIRVEQLTDLFTHS